ncbi:FAD-dependent oxidoreductase [Paraglaciecola sp. Hal342]
MGKTLLTQQQTARVEELRAAKYQNILETNPAPSLPKVGRNLKMPAPLIVRKNDGTEQEVHADKILIATGSTPTIPPIDGLTETPYWTSTESLFAQELPQHLVVIGSSVVAAGDCPRHMRRLGSEVTVLARHTLLYWGGSLAG